MSPAEKELTTGPWLRQSLARILSWLSAANSAQANLSPIIPPLRCAYLSPGLLTPLFYCSFLKIP